MDMKEISSRRKELILDVFSSFIKICTEQKIRYYAAFGTAIGAVRHHGMIPWDDDIDVIMPRPDYERFRSYCDNNDIGKFKLITPEDKNYYLTFPKFVNNETTLLELKKFSYVIGIFIDIFIMEGADNDLNSETSRHNKMFKLANDRYDINSHYSLNDYWDLLKRLKIRRLFNSIFKYPNNRDKYRLNLIKQCNDILSRVPYDEGNYISIYGTIYKSKCIFPKSWFDSTVSFKYEGMDVLLPIQYDKMLKKIYGDYMKLPPMEKRKSGHSSDYLNLERAESLEDVLLKINEKN